MMNNIHSDKELLSGSNKSRLNKIIAWSLVTIVCAVAIISWGGFYQWQLWPLSIYQLFPLLGLLAFSVMWSHYMMNTLRTLWPTEKQVLSNYFRWTGYAVLVLICLHPGLLIYQRFQDGYGLPPGSYESYVAPGMGWVTLLGTASLFIFLSFELYRFFGKRRWWQYVADASDVAMLAIIYHGLRLGTQLQQGWFRL
ncbi:MAG: hypothetical protein ABI716_00820, partial [Candidatus Saccharibacteria bacterium]